MCVPSVPWTCPICPVICLVCPADILPLEFEFPHQNTQVSGCFWDVPSLSLGCFRGMPTTKFLCVVFLYRLFVSIIMASTLPEESPDRAWDDLSLPDSVRSSQFAILKMLDLQSWRPSKEVPKPRPGKLPKKCFGKCRSETGCRRQCRKKCSGPRLLHYQKNPFSVRKIRVRNSGAGNGCANFMDTWKKCVLSAGKTIFSIKFPFFGVFFWGGGGSADFIFMGARIFLTLALHLPRHPVSDRHFPKHFFGTFPGQGFGTSLDGRQDFNARSCFKNWLGLRAWICLMFETSNNK